MASQSEWNTARPTWKWLFAHMDKDKNSQLDRAEYQAFQDFKKEHSDWRKKLEAKPSTQNAEHRAGIQADGQSHSKLNSFRTAQPKRYDMSASD